MEELENTIKHMTPDKAPGLDGLPLNIWKLPSCKEVLLLFCNVTLSGNRPAEWGLSVSVPNKGDLTKKLSWNQPQSSLCKKI